LGLLGRGVQDTPLFDPFFLKAEPAFRTKLRGVDFYGAIKVTFVALSSVTLVSRSCSFGLLFLLLTVGPDGTLRRWRGRSEKTVLLPTLLKALLGPELLEFLFQHVDATLFLQTYRAAVDSHGIQSHTGDSPPRLYSMSIHDARTNQPPKRKILKLPPETEGLLG
jgi:hypothetical protein